MLNHKDFVDKIYQYQNLAREINMVENEIKMYILKDAELSSEEESEILREVNAFLREAAVSNDFELCTAKLDLIIAQLRVKKLTARSQNINADNVLCLKGLDKLNSQL